MDLLHHRKASAVKSGLRFLYKGVMRDRAPCFGALGFWGEDQLFALDAACACMKAEVNGTSGDPRAWGHYLGLDGFDIVHIF